MLNYSFKSFALSLGPWSGDYSSVEACDYRLCVFGNRDGPSFCLSAALAGWTGVMLSSCFSSSTWVWLPSLVSLFPTISLSPYLALSLFSLSLFFHFSLSLSFHFSLSRSLTLGTAPLPDHLGLSSTKVCVRWCKCLCVLVYACTSRQACVSGSLRAVSPQEGIYVYVYVCVFVFWCVCVCVCVCVSRRVFLRQVDSCYLVALQPSQQSQGEWAGGLNPLYSKTMLNMDKTPVCVWVGVCVCVCVEHYYYTYWCVLSVLLYSLILHTCVLVYAQFISV